MIPQHVGDREKVLVPVCFNEFIQGCDFLLRYGLFQSLLGQLNAFVDLVRQIIIVSVNENLMDLF